MEAARAAGAPDPMDESKGGGESGFVEEGSRRGPDGRAGSRRVGDSAATEEGSGSKPGGWADSWRGVRLAAMEEARSADAREEKTNVSGGESSSGKKRRRPLTLSEEWNKESVWIKKEGIRREQETAEFMKRFPNYVPKISDSDEEVSWDSNETYADEEFVNPDKGGTEGELALPKEGGAGDSGWVTVRKTSASSIGN